VTPLPTLSKRDFALLRAWFAIAPDAMIAADGEGRIVLANTQAERLFGYEPEALAKLLLEELIPGPLRHSHALHRARYMSDPRLRPMGIGYELMGLKRDGRQFPVEIGLSPIVTETGTLAIASVRDISETRRVRKVLERADRDLVMAQIGHAALESTDYELAIRRIPELVASALKVQAVTFLSTDWRHKTLHTRAATGLSANTIDALASALTERAIVQRFFVAREQVAITLEQMQEQDLAPVLAVLAETGFADMVLVPLFGRHEFMGLLAVLATEARSFDDDKVTFLQSVAKLLAAAILRSRSDERLAHAQKLEAVGQLTGGIAHDFNNLLTVISGNLQLLEAEMSDSEELQDIIASALRAVDRGADLTRRLLAFGRRQSLQPRAVVPKPLLDELGHMLARTLGESIAIEVDCAADVPDVYADPNELDTALINLALNARDAMPRGGCLTIAARETTIEAADQDARLPPGRYVSFEIGDTGTGMSPEVQARALEPFFTTKEADKGNGLGLSMVYGFVTQSGGSVAIDSRLGYGTRVRLLLPVANACSGPFSVEATPDEPATREDTGKSHETILIVEDEPDVRTIAARFLRAIGYRVIAVATAREALELLTAENIIDLLFSDVTLGSGMDGIELAQRARDIRPQLAVLLTSGYPGPETELRMQGTTDNIELLRKPYRREDLAGAVKRVLARA